MGGQKDFFISRAGVDADVATWIARLLERNGYSCILQDRDFRLGAHFPQAMEDAFENSKAMIAVLSQAYTESSFCRDEWSVAYTFHRKDGTPRLLPVRVAPGRLPPLAEAIAYVDLVGLTGAEEEKRLLDGAAAFLQGKELPDALAPTATAPINANFFVPNFTGRDDALSRLHEVLWSQPIGSGRAIALTGLGGLGKTALALEYARRQLHRYAGAWLLPAGEYIKGLAELATELNRHIPAIPDESTAQKGILEAQRLARSTGKPFLLIFDNLDVPSELPHWARGDWLHLILTSRYNKWSGDVTALEVDNLPTEAASTLLASIVGRPQGTNLHPLVELLGGLPLAIFQAGAFLRENPSLSVPDYANTIAGRVQSAPDDWPKNQQLVDATVVAAIERVETLAPGARELMERAALYHPNDIPFADLCQLGVNEPAERASDALVRYSLWNSSVDGETRSVHRVVQLVMRAALSIESRISIAVAARKPLVTRMRSLLAEDGQFHPLSVLWRHLTSLSEVFPLDDARRMASDAMANGTSEQRARLAATIQASSDINSETADLLQACADYVESMRTRLDCDLAAAGETWVAELPRINLDNVVLRFFRDEASTLSTLHASLGDLSSLRDAMSDQQATDFRASLERAEATAADFERRAAELLDPLTTLAVMLLFFEPRVSTPRGKRTLARRLRELMSCFTRVDLACAKLPPDWTPRCIVLIRAQLREVGAAAPERGPNVDALTMIGRFLFGRRSAKSRAKA